MLVVYFCGQFNLPELFVSVGLDLLLALDDETQGGELARAVTYDLRLDVLVPPINPEGLEAREGRSRS